LRLRGGVPQVDDDTEPVHRGDGGTMTPVPFLVFSRQLNRLSSDTA
jgi:hypothetical protein